jgi:WD40 repeat protein
MRRFPVPTVAALSLTAVLFAASADADKAQADLDRLAERLAKAETSSDRDKLAADLRDFRLKNPGTTLAVKAAVLLAKLPSPLDNLSAKDIPKLEKFDWQPNELVAVVGEHIGRQGSVVACVAVNPDGAVVASGGGSLIRLWRTDTMRLSSVVYHYGVSSLAFDKDGKVLVSGGGDGCVRVWDLAEEGKPPVQRGPGVTMPGSAGVTSVSITPDGKLAAAAVANGDVHLIDVGAKEPADLINLTNEHSGGATAVAFTPDGKELLSGGNDGQLKLWKWTVADGKLEVKDKPTVLLLPKEKDKEKDKPPAPVKALAVIGDADDKGQLADARTDGALHLWNLPASSTAKPRLTITPAAAPTAVVFSKNQTLAAACTDGVVRIWGTGGYADKPRHEVKGHVGPVNAVAFSPNEKLLFAGGVDWMVRSWDVSAKPKERFQPVSHLSAAYGVALAPDGRRLATASQDGILRLWDLTSKVPFDSKYVPPPKPADGGPLTLAAYSPDGVAVAVGGSGNPNARVHDAGGGQLIGALPGHPLYLSGIAFGADYHRVLTSGGKTLYLWEVNKGKEAKRIHSFPDHDTPIICMALSPDGKHALSGSGANIRQKDGLYKYEDSVLRLWDADKAEELACDKSSKTPLATTGFAADGRDLFSGAFNEPTLRRWDGTKRPLAEVGGMPGQTGYANAVIPSPDGLTLATRNFGGAVVVWDLQTGNPLVKFDIKEDVCGLSFSGDSRHLAVGLATGPTYILRLRGVDK